MPALSQYPKGSNTSVCIWSICLSVRHFLQGAGWQLEYICMVGRGMRGTRYSLHGGEPATSFREEGVLSTRK